jgi:hypothetical protein
MNKTKIEVPRSLIAHYLGGFVDFILYLDSESGFLEPSSKEKSFQEIKIELMQKGEQVFLAYGLLFLIDFPPEEYLNFSDQEESLIDEDMQYLVKTLYQKVKPKAFDETMPVEITSQSLADFRVNNGIYYQTQAGETLASIAHKKSLSTKQLAKINPYMFQQYDAKEVLPEGKVFGISNKVYDWL